MWVVIDSSGVEVYHHVDWDVAVKWAMVRGGDMDIVWRQGWGER